MDAGIEPEQAGFTLIELLVTVAVLSVLAVGASLAASQRSGAEGDAQRFASSYAAARQMAVQGQERRGLVVTPRGSRGARWHDGGWQETGRETLWRGSVALTADSAARGPGPGIVFLPNGRTSAFSIRFGDDRKTRCRSDGWSGLTCDAG